MKRKETLIRQPYVWSEKIYGGEGIRENSRLSELKRIFSLRESILVLMKQWFCLNRSTFVSCVGLDFFYLLWDLVFVWLILFWHLANLKSWKQVRTTLFQFGWVFFYSLNISSFSFRDFFWIIFSLITDVLCLFWYQVPFSSKCWRTFLFSLFSLLR